jgi:DNA-binding FadR family transcriptional regulator
MTTDYQILIEPVKNRRIFEEVSDKLKELIFNGTFKPGHQLPSESALAKLFHVGRQSVREALRVLEISGFITTRPGLKGGAVIEGTLLSKLSNLFLETFKFHRASLEDCVIARRAIEMSVLEFALKNAEESDIEALQRNIALAKAKLNAGAHAFEENLEFHRLLAKASKNYVFSIVMESLLTIFADVRIVVGPVALRQSRAIVSCHEDLLAAIVAKKKSKACELLERDLGVAQQHLLALGEKILIGGRSATGSSESDAPGERAGGRGRKH